jgi:hypothetical protein
VRLGTAAVLHRAVGFPHPLHPLAQDINRGKPTRAEAQLLAAPLAKRTFVATIRPVELDMKLLTRLVRAHPSEIAP